MLEQIVDKSLLLYCAKPTKEDTTYCPVTPTRMTTSPKSFSFTHWQRPFLLIALLVVAIGGGGKKNECRPQTINSRKAALCYQILSWHLKPIKMVTHCIYQKKYSKHSQNIISRQFSFWLLTFDSGSVVSMALLSQSALYPITNMLVALMSVSLMLVALTSVALMSVALLAIALILRLL